MRYLQHLCLIVCAVLLTACASSHILVGKKRPPIDPGLVKLYVQPPKQYENVAIVNASSKNSFAFTEQGKVEDMIDLLKEEAAQLGANGVLLQSTGEQSGGAVGTGFGTATAYGSGNMVNSYGAGSTFFIPVQHKTGQGMAIFVIEE